MSKVYIVFCMDTEGPCDDPDNDSLLKTWKDVDHAMDKLFDRKFRFKYKDSMGNGLKIGWFFLTWTGFKTNPRGRDFGYHKVRDHYSERWGKLMDDYGDEECCTTTIRLYQVLEMNGVRNGQVLKNINISSLGK